MVTFFILSVVLLAIAIVVLAALGLIGGIIGVALVVIADIVVGVTPFIAAGYLIWWLFFKKKEKGDKK